jgi:hypothetical protein
MSRPSSFPDTRRLNERVPTIPAKSRKALRLTDKGYVVIDNVAFIGPIQFYVTRAAKKYGGTISNEGTTDIRVQLETGAGDIGLPKTLFPGTWLEFDDFPLSGITLYGTGTYSLMAWAGPNPFGKIKYYPRPTVNAIITGLPTPLPVSFATPVPVSGTFWPATQPISGTVSVGNFPAGFNVNNFPANYAINNFPNPQNVNIAEYLGLAVGPANPMDVKVSNFPATQPISGSVSVSNFPAFPATQNVNITEYLSLAVGPANPMDVKVSNFPATQPISGSVSVSNFPATYPATQSGAWTVGVNNFPATYAATQSGAWTVNVGNFPATYDVSDRVARVLGKITDGTNALAPFPVDGDAFSLTARGVLILGKTGGVGFNYRIPILDSGHQFVVTPKALNKTTIIQFANQAGVGSTNVYTVTAGKTFYLVAAVVYAIDTTALQVSSATLEVDTGGNGVFRIIANTVVTGASSSGFPLSFGVPMPFAAASVFRVHVYSGAAGSFSASITGWED